MTDLFPVLHYGALHAYEKLLVALIALGPFIVMFVVVMIQRRRDVASEEKTPLTRQEGPSSGGVSGLS